MRVKCIKKIGKCFCVRVPCLITHIQTEICPNINPKFDIHNHLTQLINNLKFVMDADGDYDNHTWHKFQNSIYWYRYMYVECDKHVKEQIDLVYKDIDEMFCQDWIKCVYN